MNSRLSWDSQGVTIEPEQCAQPEPSAALSETRAVPVVRARRLTKSFGQTTALQDVNFTLRRGRIYGLIGNNGAGKSTLLRLILGLMKPSSGRIEVFGHRYENLPSPVNQVGALLDASRVTPGWSGRTELRQSAKGRAISQADVEFVAEEAGLLAPGEQNGPALLDRMCTNYSMGNLQRLGLARARLSQPSFLVLDEPTTGLDAAGLEWLRATVREVAELGGAVLLSTHVMSEISALATDVLLLHQGLLVHSGPLAGLSAACGEHTIVHGERRDFLAQVLRAEGLAVSTIGPTDGSGLRVLGGTSLQVGKIAQKNHVALSHLSTEEQDLAQVFAELTNSPESSSSAT